MALLYTLGEIGQIDQKLNNPWQRTIQFSRMAEKELPTYIAYMSVEFPRAAYNPHNLSYSYMYSQ